MTEKIANTEAACNSLQNSIEALKEKQNNLNECFESEFSSKDKYEKALIAYK